MRVWRLPSTPSQPDRCQPETGSAEGEERNAIHELPLLPPILVGDLVELAARRRAPVRAEPRVLLRGEFHLALVPVVDDSDQRHE